MEFFDKPNVPSLRQMAMTRVAITVCRDPEIMDFVKINGCSSFIFPSKVIHKYLNVKNPAKETWKWKDLTMKIYFPAERSVPGIEPGFIDWEVKKNILPFARWEKLVEEKAPSLPKPLQRELLDVARIVSIEVDKWNEHHFPIWPNFSEIARNFQYEFQWNSFGKIDRERTTMKLITNERIDIIGRYILASIYGLTSKIPNQEKVPYEIVRMYRRRELPLFMSSALIETNRFRQKDVFSTSGYEQKLLFLKNVLENECLKYEDFVFYLSSLQDHEREELFKCCAFKILRLYFLEWPLQCMFLNAAEQLLPYITEIDFRHTLKFIIYGRIMLEWKDFNYIDLLKGFWSLSPSKLKESTKSHSIYKTLMRIINFPDDENFPSEILFKNSFYMYGLKFTYSGINYCLYRNKVSDINSFLFEFLKPTSKRQFVTTTSPRSQIFYSKPELVRKVYFR
ncbi:uncharacterized protein TNCT_238131 [Trichonephila clavata]|uniref:Uncharacterized protein n=1 Tax=Trichonephila clavata TaxID=2740835 RepID=A0A8X6JC70_TRICU|nr:uncharacterized protein TNCT_238131 [Trichonephila clavata]